MGSRFAPAAAAFVLFFSGCAEEPPPATPEALCASPPVAPWIEAGPAPAGGVVVAPAVLEGAVREAGAAWSEALDVAWRVEAAGAGFQFGATNVVVCPPDAPILAGHAAAFAPADGIAFVVLGQPLAGHPTLKARVTHELGHALGLGHSADPGDVMHEAAVVERPSPADLAAFLAL